MAANTTLALVLAAGGGLAVYTAITDPPGGLAGALSSILKGQSPTTAGSVANLGTSTAAAYAQALYVTSTSGAPSTGGVAASGAGAAVVAAAQAELGVPYRWGGTDEVGGFDCSGLAQFCYAAVGVSLPRVAAAQALKGHAVSLDALAPGDLVFWSAPASHVAIATGNGDDVIHAPHTGAVVQHARIWSRNTAYARRVLSSGGVIST